MLIVGVATLACGLATNFETLMALRIVSGATAGGVFLIALAVAETGFRSGRLRSGDYCSAAMSGNLLGASGSGVIGDIFGWRGVFFFTGAIDLVALAVAIPGFRSMGEKPGRFDLSTLVPNYRAIFSNPMAKYCFGAVFVEALFLFGVFPYMAGLLRTDGVERASIAGVVIAGFGIGGVIYTFMVAWLLANIGEMTMGFCLIVIALRMLWPVEFVNFAIMGFGFYLLHGCIQVYVTELAPAARGSATAAHSMFFFLGQAAGPALYGLGLYSIGVNAVLLIGAVALAVTGWVCVLQMRRQVPAI
jgi:predicted MFS family arabinose efflux permease